MVSPLSKISSPWKEEQLPNVLTDADLGSVWTVVKAKTTSLSSLLYKTIIVSRDGILIWQEADLPAPQWLITVKLMAMEPRFWHQVTWQFYLSVYREVLLLLMFSLEWNWRLKATWPISKILFFTFILSIENKISKCRQDAFSYFWGWHKESNLA